MPRGDHRHRRRHRHRRHQRRGPAAPRVATSTCRRTSPSVPTATSTSSTGTTTASAASRTASFETMAGTGELGDAKDGVAIYAQFNHPTNVAFDHEGRMIIAAWHNSLIKRLDLTTGLVTNLAGTGARAFGGDGGPGNDGQARPAELGGRRQNSNIIISDQANYRLRVLEPSDIINTFAGIGTPGTPATKGPPSRRSSTARRGSRRRRRAASPSTRSNNIYIADTGNNKIRMINEVGTIHTIAGTGVKGYAGDGGPALSAQFDTPSDIAVGAERHALHRRHDEQRRARDQPGRRRSSTFAGTGTPASPATAVRRRTRELDRPYGVGLAPNGDVYVADTQNQRVRWSAASRSRRRRRRARRRRRRSSRAPTSSASICTYVGNGLRATTARARIASRPCCTGRSTSSSSPSAAASSSTGTTTRCARFSPDETIADDRRLGLRRRRPGGPERSDAGGRRRRSPSISTTRRTCTSSPTATSSSWRGTTTRSASSTTRPVACASSWAPAPAASHAGDGVAGQGRARQPAAARRLGSAAATSSSSTSAISASACSTNFATDRENAIVKTVVGTASPARAGGFNGDGLALATQVSFPTGGNPEPSGGLGRSTPHGTLYFSDTNNNRIRMIDLRRRGDFKDGSVTTSPAPATRLQRRRRPRRRGADQLPRGPGDRARRQPLLRRHQQQPRPHDRPDHAASSPPSPAPARRAQRRRRPGASTRQLNRPFGIAFDRRRRPLHLRHVQQPHPQGEAVEQ